MAKLQSTRLNKIKISIPLSRGEIVSRQRLIDKLDSGLDNPLTLVCAGAGFGKTTLVSAWINKIAAEKHTDSMPQVAWLSLDKHDSDPNQFLRYFVFAIHTIFPSACAQTMGLLKNQSEPPLTLLLAVLTNDILQLPSPIVIVLDDYHYIHGTAVHDLLNELLNHWPKPLHLVLISRYTPPLPLARLRANGELVEIRNQDLRFTPDEVSAYVSRMGGVPLSQTSLDLLIQKTEGWIVSLQLASLSLRVSDNAEEFLDSLSGSETEVAEYMANEVLANQPYAIQTFLFKISILDQFCVSLCEVVAANEDPEWPVGAILDRVVHYNLFITPLDNSQKWFRFHHLFRSFLQQRLITRFSQDEIADLHRKGAKWLAQNGLLDTAVHHALNTQDMNLAADLMEQSLCDVLNREDSQTLKRWIQLLPEQFINSRPGLLIIKGWLLSFAWHIDRTDPIVQQLETMLDTDEQRAAPSPEYRQILQGQLAVFKAQKAFQMGQPALCVTYGQEALALLPPSWFYARGGIMSFLALSMQAVGDETAAEEMLQEHYSALLDKTDNYAARHILTLSLISLQAGKLEQAEQTASLLLQLATSIESVFLQGWAHLILGLVYYQWNHLDIAGKHFEEIIAKRYRVHSFISRLGNAGAAWVYLAAGRHKEAAELVGRLCQFDMEVDGRLDDLTQSLAAKVAFAANHVEKAERWADSFTAPIAPILFVFSELPQLTRAQLLLGRGSTGDNLQALQILDNLIDYAEQNHNIRRQIEVLATKALALDIQGNASAARMALKQAVELARPGGFIRVFVDLGPRIQKILTTLIVPDAYTAFLHQILQAFPHQSPPDLPLKLTNGKTHADANAFQIPPELVEPLTPREIEVLKLLREPVSPKEIALTLNISYSTVKRHTINLYGKLGVSSRWDAVSQAELLGIYSPR